MENFDGFLDAFINGDYFIVFLAMVLIILAVLVVALIKTREDYKNLLEAKGEVEETKEQITEPDMFDDLMAVSNEDEIDEDKPLIKQIDVSAVKTYDEIVDEYELSEEENAVISAEELSQKTKERMEALGASSNQVAIQKYEEEQENKAIISYEQLLVNASNITLSYKEENNKVTGAPKVNKIEVHQNEVTPCQSYLKEEEFLKILKEFRTTLE